jgi:hypothetical protein
MAEKVVKNLIAILEKTLPVEEVVIVKGNHELQEENYSLYLRKALHRNSVYASRSIVKDIGNPVGHYNVLFTHGSGSSQYYPVPYSVIRDLWKILSDYKYRDIIVERCCIGHCHWLNLGLEVEGFIVDEIGGFQKWEYTIHQRPCGMILYFFSRGECFPIAIRPDPEVESKEKSYPALEYKNLAYCAKMLMEHLETEELKDSSLGGQDL